MNFKQPLIPSDKPDIFYLSPIPVLQKKYDDEEFHQKVYDLGFAELTAPQKLMGQELPGRYDKDRQKDYQPWCHTDDAWTEHTEFNPIGSRFSVPPNDVLDSPHEYFQEIRKRVEDSFFQMLDELEIPHENKCEITESWMQYYDPYEGRGHNKHNHCRWSPLEEPVVGFSGGYYLSDGEPIKDHPYSGAFCFHLRGMTHFVRPKRGMLMMWPYDIVHSVKPFYGKSHRCVINFNIQLPR
jgi:hypothetical protein